jgi:hypothetical protein
MQSPNLDRMLDSLRAEPAPVDELTRARWLARLGPELDAIDERRRPGPRRFWSLALAGVAVAGVAAFALWPRSEPPPAPAQVALDRARLHPYVVAGIGADSAATTLLAGRFAKLDVPKGELVRAELDGARISAVGPARLEITSASSDAVELAASGTVVLEAHAAPSLIVHAGAMTVRAQNAVFAVSATGSVTSVIVERGTIELGGETLHAGEHAGPPAELLGNAVRDHLRAPAPGGDDTRIVAVAAGAFATTEGGGELGTGPLWARVGGDVVVTRSTPTTNVPAPAPPASPARP